MSPILAEKNDILDTNLCTFTSEEIVKISSIQSKKKNKRSCSFCKLHDHTISNCKEKLKYGKISTSSEVMDYIKHRAPFKTVHPSMVNEIIYDWDFKLVQHVILHNIQCKINTNGTRPTINEMIVNLQP